MERNLVIVTLIPASVTPPPPGRFSTLDGQADSALPPPVVVALLFLYACLPV